MLSSSSTIMILAIRPSLLDKTYGSPLKGCGDDYLFTFAMYDTIFVVYLCYFK